MYPGPKELIIDTPNSVAERLSRINGDPSNTNSLSSWLHYTINVTYEEVAMSRNGLDMLKLFVKYFDLKGRV